MMLRPFESSSWSIPGSKRLVLPSRTFSSDGRRLACRKVNCNKVLNHSIEDSQTSQPVDSLTHRTQYSRLAIECRRNHEFSRSIYGRRQRALAGAVRRAEVYSGLVRWEVSRFCGSGNRPHLISSCLCDTRRSEFIRSNAIVAAAITVLGRSTPFFQAKCECQRSRRGLNRRVSSVVSGTYVAMSLPLKPLHRAQAQQRFSREVAPWCFSVRI